MYKIFIIILLFTLTGCTTKYTEINASIDEIESVEEYLNLIEIAKEFDFEYFHFLDLRTKDEYNNARISHFKNNIDYSKSNNEELLLKQVSQYKKKSFIILISNTNDNLSSEASLLLQNNGFINIKEIIIGFQEFENQLKQMNLDHLYLNYNDCGC